MQKTIAITGANTGMGKETALSLAKKGHRVLMLARNEERGAQAVGQVRQESGNPKVELVLCDLGSPSSIAECAQALASLTDHLDLLINNAGVITIRREQTEAGFEKQLGINHLGHFSLTVLLRHLLAAANEPRVITVSSHAHKWGRIHWDDPFLTKGYHAAKAYGQSKLANILFTVALAQRLGPLNGTAYSLHPGAVSTDFGVNRDTGFGKTVHRMLRPFFLTAEQGAQTAIYLADAEEVEQHSGAYFYRKKPYTSVRIANMTQDAERLWAWSEEQTGMHWT